MWDLVGSFALPRVPSINVFSYFPFGGRMWDLIV